MKKYLLSVSAVAAIATSVPASAAVTWNWSFAGEAGTFTTDGNAPGNVAAPGTYNFSDFSVTASPFGRPLGSVSGGGYSAAGFSTNTPYSFNWDGSNVTFWNSSGGNSFNWWVFQNVASPNLYHFFGWNSGNVNDATSAALYDSNTGGGANGQLVGPVSVSVASPSTSAVPEPATWAMMLAGFGLAGAAMRRRQNVRVSFA